MKVIENQTFDRERALYGNSGVLARNCSFDGPADGESAFKEGKDIEVAHCFFNLRYPFWHGENVTVKDSVVKGEYLAWYSDGLTLINCKIIGTQPLCYCQNLKLINCEMIDTDLAFEKSEVEAVVTTKVDSTKNPLSGRICKKFICMALLFMILFMMTACGKSQTERNSDRQTENDLPSSAQSDTKPEELRQPESETESDVEAQTGIQTTESAREEIEREETEMKMKIQVGDITFMAALADNSSVDALKELMADGPLTLNMSDYAGMEKGVDLGVTLSQNNEQMNTQAGDIILYQGRTFVIYYDTNSWSLTPIGKIDNVNTEELREVLGTGDVTITLSIE